MATFAVSFLNNIQHLHREIMSFRIVGTAMWYLMPQETLSE